MCSFVPCGVFEPRCLAHACGESLRAAGSPGGESPCLRRLGVYLLREEVVLLLINYCKLINADGWTGSGQTEFNSERLVSLFRDH